MSEANDRWWSPEASDSPSTGPESISLSSGLSSLHHRPGYHRLASTQVEESSHNEEAGSISELPPNDSVHGLQIRFSDHDAESLKFGANVDPSPNPQPESAAFLPSPLSAQSNGTKRSRQASLGGRSPYTEDDISSLGRSSVSSLSRLHAPFIADPDDESLQRAPSVLKSTKPFDTSTLHEGEPRCKTRRHFHHARGTWLSITILTLSVFSTVFSGIWLAVAIVRPRYGTYIANNGPLPPSTASLLTAAFAKLIELSFVTVFVTFLGQVLSQRAFRDESKGISIAEMQMRAWVQQPGTMITQFHTVRHASLTFLGALALVTALVAMVYTTASDALVAPKLKFGRIQNRQLAGAVSQRFGYETWIEDICFSPISRYDDTNAGQTCAALQYTGHSYYSYAQYLNNFAGIGDIPDRQEERPLPMALMSNTSIVGSWIEQKDMAKQSAKYGRIINNVTVAMPHYSIYDTASDPLNEMMQPDDLDGLGAYYLEASVPSPAINVLCAGVTEEELKPMVLSLWDGYNGTQANGTVVNNTNYPGGWHLPSYPDWLNETDVDDVFGLGEKYGRRMPIFPKLPLPYNTVLNVTAMDGYVVTDSIYILGAHVPDDTANTANASYMMCSLRAYMAPECSTAYNVSMSGGVMNTKCNDRNSSLSYLKSHPEATSGVYIPDWVNVANVWANALSLAAGLSDDYAANARLLTQLIPTSDTLDETVPSIAEALAVLASGTLLLSSQGAPLIHYWNYSDPTNYAPENMTLPDPQLQIFNATLQYQDFSSGGTQRWQGIFYPVLAAVFVLNVVCLVYFLAHRGLVTDFVEPPNLFALALNSRPSRALEGSCGGGPEPEQLSTHWHIDLDRSRDHFHILSREEPPALRPRRKKPPRKEAWEMELENSRMAQMYDHLSRKRSSLL